MKTSYIANSLFYFNLVIIAILSFGAAFFILIPVIMFGASIEDAIGIVTQNWVMVGMWLIYFTSIVFYPILQRYKNKKVIIMYISFAIPILIFILFSFGILPCWEATILKQFGMDYNHGIRCVQ